MATPAARPPSGGGGGNSSRPHQQPHKGDQRRSAPVRESISLTEQHGILQEKSKGGFICKMKFSNETPDLPFDPKFLAYPFDPSRLTKYRPTMLEKMHKYTLLTEPDLGIHIDLIEPEAYEPPETGGELLPEDEVLLQEEERAGKKPSFLSSDGHARPNVPWLHKTAYYGNDDLYGMNQGGRAIKELPVPIQEEVKELTPQELVDSIEESFNVINGIDGAIPATLKHPKDPSLVPVAVWKVLPDFDRWQNDYTEVVFDHDPALDDVEFHDDNGADTFKKRAALCSGALVRIHGQGNRLNYAYMVPAPGSRKRKRLLGSNDAEEEEEEEEGPENFQCLREYCQNQAREYEEEWKDDHFIFALSEGTGTDLEATYHRINERTYFRKDKYVLTMQQLGSLGSSSIKQMIRKGKRVPMHSGMVVSTRGLTDQEKQEMNDARRAIEEEQGQGAGRREENGGDDDNVDKGGSGSARRGGDSSSSSSEDEGNAGKRGSSAPAKTSQATGRGRGKKAAAQSDSSSSESDG